MGASVYLRKKTLMKYIFNARIDILTKYSSYIGK